MKASRKAANPHLDGFLEEITTNQFKSQGLEEGEGERGRQSIPSRGSSI